METATSNPAVGLYLDLLKKSLIRSIGDDNLREVIPARGTLRRTLSAPVRAALESRQLTIARRVPAVASLREDGRDLPQDAETMIGLKRLNNIQYCIEQVLQSGVEGDLIETGVWRGGATILMRGILKAYGVTDRTVWVADSFQGLPEADPEKYPADSKGQFWSRLPQLPVSVEQVRANFERYGLLDEQVRFLVGWFRDTLSPAPIERLAVMRLDGEMSFNRAVAPLVS